MAESKAWEFEKQNDTISTNLEIRPVFCKFYDELILFAALFTPLFLLGSLLYILHTVELFFDTFLASIMLDYFMFPFYYHSFQDFCRICHLSCIGTKRRQTFVDGVWMTLKLSLYGNQHYYIYVKT